MVFAQIKNDVVVNIIILDDVSLINKFSSDAGFDHCVRICNRNPIPQIGWNYFPSTTESSDYFSEN